MRRRVEGVTRPILIGLVLFSWVAGCVGDRDQDPGAGSTRSGLPGAERLVERLISEDPQILLPRDQLFQEETAFNWTFASGADLAPWKTQGLAPRSRLNRRQWVLKSAGGVPQLERRLDLDASELHRLEVGLTAPMQGKVTLYWAGPGESFAEERSLKLEPPARRRQRPVTLTFQLASHRFWSGRVERLRLDPSDDPRDTVRLRSIRGVRRVVDSEQLASALTRGWKVDLDADVRNVLLAVPGVATERQLEVGRGQRLRFAYGLERTVQQPVEFRIEAAPEGRDPEVLFQETLDPAADETGSWRQASVDLDAYAGQQLQLKLETHSPELLDLARGFPLWANPEVLGPGDGDELPNIILISLDTLRSDRLSAYGHGVTTSPNLDGWAAESAALFENAVVQAPWTLPSHASMFTGLEALRHDVNHYQEASASLELLAETLHRAGYLTAAITGGGYLRPQFGFAQGFDMFRYWPQILAERELADGTGRLWDWLEANHQRRFFLLFHTYEIHFPHRRRQPYFDQLYGDRFPSDETASEAERMACGRAGAPSSSEEDEIRGAITMRARPQDPTDPLWQHDYFAVKLPSGEEVEHLNPLEKELIRACYDSAIAYADAQLGELFERLSRLGLKGRTLIVLTSDHGEALGERDRAGHNYHEDYNVMVPLVIELPDGLGAGQKIAQQVRSIDIVPTILDAIGLAPEQPLDGVSLLPLLRGESSSVPAEAWTYASSANYGLGLRYRNQLKYIFNNTAWSEVLGSEALYNLRQDPAEVEDQAPSHPSTESLRSKAQEAAEAQHEGLRMQIRNLGEGRLSGRLKYAWARDNRVKTADLSCRCLSWGEDKSANFSLAAGQEVTLYFESIPGHRLGIEGQLALPGQAAVAFEEEFDSRKLDRPVVFEHSAEGWQREWPDDAEADSEATETDTANVDAIEAPAVGFKIWRASQRVTGQVVAPVDSALQKQLEALGYVN